MMVTIIIITMIIATDAASAAVKIKSRAAEINELIMQLMVEIFFTINNILIITFSA